MESKASEIEVWRRDLHQRPSPCSIIGSDQLIVPERGAHVAAIDPTTGSTLWSARIQNTWGWLARTPDRVFYLNQHSHLQCHTAGTGALLWAMDLHGINGWLVPAGEVVVTGGWRGYTPLVGLDASDGTLRWQQGWRGRARIAKPAAGPWGLAVAALDEPVLRFLDPDDGTIQAEAPLPVHGQDPDASPLLRCYRDLLLLGGRDGRYHQLARPGDSWTVLFEHPDGIATGAPPVVGDDVLFVDTAGQLNCYGLGTAQRRWSAPWPHRRSDLLPAAASPGGLLAVGSDSGRVSVFDLDGKQLWSRVMAKRIETDLVWLDDRTLIVGTTGALIAVRLPPVDTGIRARREGSDRRSPDAPASRGS